MPKYAVISATGDGHIPFVQKHLDEQLIIVDPGKVIRGTPLSYRLAGKSFVPFYDSLNLSEVKAVWFRKPELALPASEPHRKGYDEFTRYSMSNFMRQLYGLLPHACWVSDYYALLRASDKLWQLSVASQLGFHIPDTLVTSNSAEAKDFVLSHNETIVKPIEVKVFTLAGEQRVMFTRKVDKQKINFSGLQLAPAMFQQAINVAVDIRVTVVGDKVFAASVKPKITDPSHVTVRDWRIGDHSGGTDIQAFELPSAIAKMCVRHVKEMGLKYGGIDLILDKKGTFWFLENNPNGQWAFVEVATGQPIGKAVADLLTTGK